MKFLFKLRGSISKRQGLILSVIGILIALGVWIFLSWGENPLVISYMLPSPGKVISSYSDLYTDNDIIRNTCLSVGLNLAGYLEAILISVPLGLLIGLLPLFRGSFKGGVDAIRYVPLTALTGLFIVWFGVDTDMKVHFLAFGIIIYMLPVIVQRIDEVNDVYLKTVFTLGASGWQTVRTVYFPAVMSRLSDDIRVLTAISWTYIIVAEGMGSTGGIGALIWRAGLRQGRVDKVFAILLIIIIIGVIQDRLFVMMDKALFPHKYQMAESERSSRLRQSSVFSLIWSFLKTVGIWMTIALYGVLLIDAVAPFLAGESVIGYLFGDTSLAVHTVMLAFAGYHLWRNFSSSRIKEILLRGSV